MAERFEFITEKYIGNLAYLLVLNSMIFRIPPGLKRFYSPLMMGIESLAGRFQGRLMSCMVVCRSTKK